MKRTPWCNPIRRLANAGYENPNDVASGIEVDFSRRQRGL